MDKKSKLQYEVPLTEVFFFEPDRTLAISPTQAVVIDLTSGTSPEFSGFNNEVIW